MGQAKIRGSFETRQAEAIIANNKKLQKEIADKITYENSLTREQKDKRKELNSKFMMFATIAATISV